MEITCWSDYVRFVEARYARVGAELTLDDLVANLREFETTLLTARREIRDLEIRDLEELFWSRQPHPVLRSKGSLVTMQHSGWMARESAYLLSHRQRSASVTPLIILI
jgi:hypothetical protein